MQCWNMPRHKTRDIYLHDSSFILVNTSILFKYTEPHKTFFVHKPQSLLSSFNLQLYFKIKYTSQRTLQFRRKEFELIQSSQCGQ